MSGSEGEPIRGQILALSGGGYRGLYTAKILACLEESLGHRIARHFDLLAGTSIGGIIALGLACELPAANLVGFFEEHGSVIFKKRAQGFFKSKYASDGLAQLLGSADVFGSRTLADCSHPVVIPSISYTTGDPVMFKTAHHSTFHIDHKRRLVDVALATSAAPSYFPRHVFDHTQYVDGGLIANAPGLIALHEMETFLGVPASNVRLMSIGTMSSKYTVDPARNREGGAVDWGGGNPIEMSRRLFGLAISAHETLTYYMLRQRLPDNRYMHVDDTITDQSARAVDLDKTDAAAQEILLGRAIQRAKVVLGDPQYQSLIAYEANAPHFFHGLPTSSSENANA
ncbi:CBASS cGAMP-activated phospholipase [Rhodanobacter sp. ANJX3]|uniref:CBASS cGAMP-activated phospholipase n=1 Tax=Rhodanobacter sp. ANJX3 TaxID=2723083 RepID=UPI0016072951|nr:CBASS cGAMP-activated phospholipase [Rhodanobacter sp. ANJX3]